jgi:hypothetical protein
MDCVMLFSAALQAALAAGRRIEAVDRAHEEDHAAIALVAHGAPRRLRAEDLGRQIEAQHRVEAALRHVEPLAHRTGLRAEAAGIVDPDVDAAEFLERQIGEGLDLAKIGDVGLACDSAPAFRLDLPPKRIELHLIARRANDIRPLGGISERDSTPESAARAGDHGDFPFERKHTWLLAGGIDETVTDHLLFQPTKLHRSTRKSNGKPRTVTPENHQMLHAAAVEHARRWSAT